MFTDNWSNPDTHSQSGHNVKNHSGDPAWGVAVIAVLLCTAIAIAIIVLV